MDFKIIKLKNLKKTALLINSIYRVGEANNAPDEPISNN
jgi:hypothetical protein